MLIVSAVETKDTSNYAYLIITKVKNLSDL